jgi:uncharacterized protein YndB with AHSA1/START domain
MPTTVKEVRSSTRIHAPIEVAWKALTTPALIKRWFFGVDTESDWKVGSQLVHRGVYQGKPYVDKGEILEFKPPRRLVHTHWSAGSCEPDRADSYQVVQWDLAEEGGGTVLTVTEQNLPSDDAATTSERAWKGALGSLRDMLEH